MRKAFQKLIFEIIGSMASNLVSGISFIVLIALIPVLYICKYIPVIRLRFFGPGAPKQKGKFFKFPSPSWVSSGKKNLNALSLLVCVAFFLVIYCPYAVYMHYTSEEVDSDDKVTFFSRMMVIQLYRFRKDIVPNGDIREEVFSGNTLKSRMSNIEGSSMFFLFREGSKVYYQVFPVESIFYGDAYFKVPSVVELKENDYLPLSDIQFGFDEAWLGPQSRLSLDYVKRVAKDYPDYIIIIAGFASKPGEFDYNQRLGQDRAQAVYNYLVSIGFEPARLFMVSFGEQLAQSSRSSSATASDYQRVELFLISDPDLPSKLM